MGEVIAYAVDVPLNPNEFRLLIGMAHRAHDTGKGLIPARRYFDSPEATTYLLGRRIPDAAPGLTVDEKRERESGLQRVKVATAGLLRLRAIERIRSGRGGQNPEYHLHISVTRSRSPGGT